MVKNKKAQEEIVGFVLVVVIVAIVLVVFLGIIIRQEPAEKAKESRDVYQFLESTMQYTTDCSVSFEPNYLKLSELIQHCHNSLANCLSGKNTCDVAEETLKSIIEISFPIAQGSNTKGYEFKSIYTADAETTEKEIFSITKGNCSGSIRGAEFLVPSFPGTISNSLKLCY